MGQDFKDTTGPLFLFPLRAVNRSQHVLFLSTQTQSNTCSHPTHHTSHVNRPSGVPTKINPLTDTPYM